MSNDTNAASQKPAWWSQLTLRSVAGLTLMAGALGWIIGYAISHFEPSLLLAAVVAQVGFGLAILEARGLNRHDTPR
jgi:hypothetical protein